MATEARILDDPPDLWGLAESPWRWGADCPCGTGEHGPYDRPAHARWHLDWASGIALPVPCYEPLSIVTSASTLAERKAAYRLALLFRREQGYDFPQLPDAAALPSTSVPAYVCRL